MTKFLPCATATVSQLPAARVLASSLAAAGYERRLQVLVIDDVHRATVNRDEHFDLYRPEDIGVSARELHELAAFLEETELVDALRPRVLVALLDRDGEEPVVHLDVNTVVYARLEALEEAIADHPIVVLPIDASPLTRDGLRPTENELLTAGIWEPGFFTVDRPGVDFLQWWADRLRFGSAGSAGQPTDSGKWLDLASAYFELWPLNDRGVGISYLNALTRHLQWADGRYLADGVLLRSFIFRAFDPLRPWALSDLQGDRPRVLVSENPALARLCHDYAADLNRSGFEVARTERYGWSDLPDGTFVSRWIKESVRGAVVAIASGLEFERPPDPFDDASLADFYRWLASPERANEQAPSIARFFVQIYRARPDVREEFPEPTVADAARFRTWAQVHAPLEHQVPKPVVSAAFEEECWPRPREPRWSDPTALHPGYLVTGYLRAELGVGDAARRALRSMRDAGIPCGAFAYEVTKSRQEHASVLDLQGNGGFDTNVVWVNADQLYNFIRFVGPSFYEGRYTVGCWAWETENPPLSMGEMSRFVDEIWVPSEWTAAAVRSVTAAPVFVFEHPVGVPAVDASIDVRALGVPEGFIFLFMFDFLSTVSRKNPTGVIEAFRRAFLPGEGPTLVLKSINGHRAPLDVERVRIAIGDRPDIVFIDEYLTADECMAMLARANCYVSLHRSEGFGLTIAEAMALGKPVVATGYSGNLDVMSEETAYLVPGTKTTVGLGAEPYPPDGIWADPELDVAAEYMRRVVESPSDASERAAKGRQVVLSEHGHARAVKFLTSRFADIHAMRRSGHESPVAEAAREALASRAWIKPAPSEGSEES